MGIGALHGEERISLKRVCAVGLGAVGLAVLFATGDPAAEGQTALGREAALGLGAVAVATLSYVWGAIVSKPIVRTGAPVALAFWQTTIGGVALLGVSLALEHPDGSAIMNLAHGPPLAGLAFLVLFGSLVGFSIYLWLLREWGAFRTSLYAFVSPAVAVTVGVVWAGEHFGRHEAIGMAILLGAAALSVEPRRARVTAS